MKLCLCLAADVFDRWAPWYDRLLWPIDRLALDRWRRLLWADLPAGRILEVGVGTGSSFRWYPSGAAVVGIDVSSRMLTIAAAKARRGATPVKLCQMDVQQLAFPDQSFDAVVGSLVFCSVPDPMRGLQELRRVCKPGGRLRLLEHVRSEGWMGPLMDRLNEPLALRYGEHINRRTARTVQDAGWQIGSVRHLLLDIVQLIDAAPPA